VKQIRSLAFLAKGMFKECVKILQDLDHHQLWARSGIYNNLALCFEALGKLDKAKEYQLLCLQYAEEADYAVTRMLSYHNLGAYAVKLGHLTEAREHLATAWELAKSAGIGKEILVTRFSAMYADLCQVLLEKGLYCQAEAAIQSVVPTRDTGRDSLIVLI